MTSAKETGGEKCSFQLMDKARTLENTLEVLLQLPDPVVDADHDSHDSCLTAEKIPSPLPEPLLRARLLQSLKNERDSLKRLVVQFNGQLAAARREMADWESKEEPTSAPSDYSTALM